MRRTFALLLLASAFCLGVVRAHADNPEWTRPFPPFRIAGNLYYVGSEDLAAYLITTPQGNILINSNLSSSPTLIRQSIEKLGFRWSDTKILLISHAHFDHCAGSADILKQTGAKYEVMEADVPVVESGGRKDFGIGKDKQYQFTPAHVDRILHDGDTVKLGGTVLTAHKTAGHTRGNTTWTMDVNEGNKPLRVVIVGSTSVLDSYRLTGPHPSYPGIADDYRHQFTVLKSLPCDVFLGSHGVFFSLKEKYAKLAAGDKNAFVDPEGYRQFVADREQAFNQALQRQSQK